ncbi:MAG TPA: DUF5666 domain-containing protein [Candidatus Saccharimonadales bacterium]|nr:DUF5666 domain-containing protein [Candidatus Saccharimonadales bacterium]
MKKILIIILVLFFIVVNKTFAAAPTPTSSAAMNSQINQLKDKIASQVSKLNLVEKRGIIGTIQSVSNNQITLTDAKGNTRYVDVDEITKFSSGSSASFGLSDLKKGMMVRAFGIYNKESQRILARYIDTETIPTRYAGEIVAIDGKNFQITIATIDQKSVKVEIDTTSTVDSYTTGGQITKYGFSKLKTGDRVYVTGYPDKKDATLLIADRMIVYLDAPKLQNIQIVTPTIEPTIAPTSAGGKNLKMTK